MLKESCHCEEERLRGKAEANYWQDSSLLSEQALQSQDRDCFAVARNDVLCQLI